MQREHGGAGDHSSATDAGLRTEDLARPRDDRDADRGTLPAAADAPPPAVGAAEGSPSTEQAMAGTPGSSAPEQGQENEPLLSPDEAEAFKSKWQAVQTGPRPWAARFLAARAGGEVGLALSRSDQCWPARWGGLAVRISSSFG
ncbi:hypothetical protein GCM10018966_045640 [Streptomyces yanii]